MRFVENEGSLFRIVGPTNAYPDEVWNVAQRKFVPYEGDVPKPQGWGEDVSEQEAQEYMSGADASQDDQPKQAAPTDQA